MAPRFGNHFLFFFKKKKNYYILIHWDITLFILNQEKEKFLILYVYLQTPLIHRVPALQAFNSLLSH
jgi:hypothetical protein